MPEHEPFLQSCSMQPAEAAIISHMIESNEKFLGITETVNPDRETYTPLESAQIPEDKVLVSFVIPYGINMPVFYGEFYNALKQVRLEHP